MKYFFLFILFASVSLLNAQEESPFAQNEEEFKAMYERNIMKTKINGVYIPQDEDEAFEQVSKLSEEGSWDKFKSGPEELVVSKLKLGLGRWMEVNWNFQEGSRLSHYLKKKGLRHPEDMAAYLMTYFHRSLNGKPIEEEILIQNLNELRRLEAQKEIDEIEKFAKPIPKEK